MSEINTVARPYAEAQWAVLSDATEDDLTDSLNLLESLHNRWSRLMNGLTESMHAIVNCLTNH